VRVVIVDDEPLGQRGVRARLAAAPDMEVVAECATGGDAVSAIRRFSPDLVFLDIQMPDMTGFEVLRRLPDRRMPLVIFVTAHDEHALKAFDAQAVDYLLKPIDDGRFASTLERARLLSGTRRLLDFERRVRSLLEELPESPSRDGYRRRIIARARHRVSIVPVSEIDWIGATGDYVTLHVGAREHLVRQTIGSLERQLDPEMFLRIHRSTIVQTCRICELVTRQNGELLVRLRDGTELRTSRSYSLRLEEWL
jgi:two-component system LytT family response regulator